MRVDIQDSSNLGMAQPFLRDIRICTLAKHQSGMAMPDVMEAITSQPGSAHYPGECTLKLLVRSKSHHDIETLGYQR